MKLDEIIEEFDKDFGIVKVDGRDFPSVIDIETTKNFIRQAYQSGIEAALVCKPEKDNSPRCKNHREPCEGCAYVDGFNQALQAFEDNIRKLIK